MNRNDYFTDSGLFSPRKSRENERARFLIAQKIIGVFLLLLGVFFLALVSTGTTLEERNGTAAFLIIPVGLYLIFSRKVVIR